VTGNHDPKGPILVLIVEDNVDIQEAASLIFDLHWPKARIIQAYKGGDGILLAGSQSPDLVILDLGLPDMDGMRVLKEIRGFSAVPIIILTVRGEEMDKVRGLELGADDFIVKPFGHRELLARIRTVMQRHRSTTNQVAQPAQTQGATRLVMDFSSSTVWKDTKPLRLTATELSLLQYLASHSGSVLNDVEILATIWGADYTDCSEYLDVYIRRLREKLEDDPRQPRIILKEDKGYKFVQN
jgi:two-component system, OmpR family, KDP operon response regulator KdpE